MFAMFPNVRSYKNFLIKRGMHRDNIEKQQQNCAIVDVSRHLPIEDVVATRNVEKVYNIKQKRQQVFK